MSARGEHRRTSQRVRAVGAVEAGKGSAGLYILHFDPPFKHARHYLGFVGRFADVDRRYHEHVTGQGSRLVRAVVAAGHAVRLVWSIRVPLAKARRLERKLKNQGSGVRLCPECAPAARAHRTAQRAAQRRRKRELTRVHDQGHRSGPVAPGESEMRAATGIDPAGD